ncbi:MAG: hypothetical protein OHK0038_06510 [Flammeovirgaceae bacterium]
MLFTKKLFFYIKFFIGIDFQKFCTYFCRNIENNYYKIEASYIHIIINYNFFTILEPNLGSAFLSC